MGRQITNMTTIHEFTDSTGQLRRCGSLPLVTEVPVGAAFEDQSEVWTDAQIRRVLANTERTPVIEQMRDAGFLEEFTSKANQFSTAACNGWLVANSYTLGCFLGDPSQRTVYSGSYAYSKMNNGVDQGSVLAKGRKVGEEFGNVPVEVCPWNVIYEPQTRQFDELAKKNRAVQPFPARTWQGFLTGMAKGCIGGVAIQAGRDTETRMANGIHKPMRGPGNHAIIAIDIQMRPNGEFMFPAYLDWGADNGDGGFIYTTYDHYAEPFNYHEFWLCPIGQGGLN